MLLPQLWEKKHPLQPTIFTVATATNTISFQPFQPFAPFTALF
jgi:hypothetical protein